MKITVLFFIVCFIGLPHLSVSQNVYLRYDTSLPQAKYAAQLIEKSLLEHGYLLTGAETGYMINIAVDDKNLHSEAYSIIPDGKKITITGGNERGLIYGSLSVVEDLHNGIPLAKIKATSESPKLPFRAIKFNLPWDAYREGHAMDLHNETCRDVNFWREFLDMMAENRFNALTLWNLHPFTFMIKPKNFPEASPFTEKQMKEWKDLYNNIFRMAGERGIDTYIVNWNIFVSPGFSKAYNGAADSQKTRIHYGQGDTSNLIKRYTRECVTQVLEEYPNLSGIGFTLGEAMGGMTPRQRQDWVNEAIMEGMRAANRKSKLIFRVPLSANVGSGGSTNIETEALTRKSIESNNFIEGPVWAEIKFNWSHAHSSTNLIKVHGGKLNDTYFNPEPKNFKIAWMAR
ncbi:MAG: glycoside hydrolase family 20 zincin-like fold domain-containing protein, partial [Segetibacter sp.]